ncbi:MAG: Gmad2 immunoglobulin-like domain-containing protein [Anaerolineales bacterium]
MPKLITFALLATCLLQACTTPPAPTNTVLPATETLAAATEAPSQTPYVIVVTAEPTAQVVIETPSPPEDSALESILISMPGFGSFITSPVTVQGQSRPTFEQNLVIAVYSEDGNLLGLTPTTIQSPAGEPGNFSAELAFSVSSEQAGRISVYETSARDGGIIHLASIELTLRPSGSAEIVPAEFHFESINIQSAYFESGTLTVTGYSDYYFEANLGLMLCGEGGSGVANDLCGTEDNIIAAGFATIDAPDMGLPGPFSGALTYSITETTQARIVVYAASPRDGGLQHVSSIPILLIP